MAMEARDGRSVNHMRWGMIRICSCLLVIAGVSILSIPVAGANDTARVSGTYQVVHKSEAGGQARIQLQVHLVNRGTRELHIQRITLWDFSHPAKGATQACSIVIHPGDSADTAQEFAVPRAEYELWRRGARPRLVLEVAGPGGHSSTEVVRLDRVSGGKVD